MMNKQEIIDSLNKEQREPVLDYHGPSFIVAGPGSGKTRVLVARTQYMLLDGIEPENVLLFTFTNKAAREVKGRIASAVGDMLASKITMGTYHSFCCKVLKQYGERLGYKKGWTIKDSDDSKKVIRKVIKGTDLEAAPLMSFISGQKRHLITPSVAMQNAGTTPNSPASYYEKYQTELFNQNAMDFDDLIFNTIRLFELFPDVLAIINARYKYIMADESHDSANSDLKLIQLLAGESMNVCFVLDDNQSIYSFRGADIEAVLNIKNIFPGLKVYNLNQNYRCSKTIVEASKSLIAHNSVQLKKEIFTENPDGDKIMVFEEESPQMEALRISKTIQLLKSKYGYEYKDIAILYRMSAMSRIVEEILLKTKIPHRILGTINFYSRKEVKDIISFVKFLVNPYDTESFTRIVNIPKRGIGEKSIEKIVDISRSTIPPVDLLTACKSVELKGKAKTGLINFVTMIETIQNKMDDCTVPELLSEIVKMSNYYSYLKEEFGTEDYEDKIANVVELIELAYSFVTLDEFLENTSLDSKQDDEDDNRVQMLTMHLSKGLEWPVVFIIGVNEGVLPHFRAMSSQKQIEEERRLAYVGITRAKKLLFLTRPKKVQQNGYFVKAGPSRFLNEIDKRYMYKHTGK